MIHVRCTYRKRKTAFVPPAPSQAPSLPRYYLTCTGLSGSKNTNMPLPDPNLPPSLPLSFFCSTATALTLRTHHPQREAGPSVRESGTIRQKGFSFHSLPTTRPRNPPAALGYQTSQQRGEEQPAFTQLGHTSCRVFRPTFSTRSEKTTETGSLVRYKVRLS